MPSRVGADDARGGPGVGEIVDARGRVRERAVPPGNRSAAWFAEPVPAPRGSGNVLDDDDDDGVEITLDIRDDTTAVDRVRPVARGENSDVKLLARTTEKRASSSGHGVLKSATGLDDLEITLDVQEDSVVVRSVRTVVEGGEDPVPGVTMEKRSSSSYGHSVLRIASTRVKQVSRELRRIASFNRRGGGPSRIDRSKPVATHALEGLKFISGTDRAAGWTAAASFFDRKAENGRLPRSKFGECIGMKEAAFAGELFDALKRRRNIAGASINKAELREFWDQISDTSFDSRLQTFLDMVDKDSDGRISEVEFKQIIMLSASANQLTVAEQDSEEYARLIMEKLDPHGLGYIELYNLETLLLKPPTDLMSQETTTNNDEPSKPMAKTNLLMQWYRHARYFLKDNWRRCWVILLWLSICASLFAWKFVQYRHRAVFKVMGYCVCVAKGGAEMLKFNMALTLLPVCRNTVTWLRTRTTAGQFVPFNDNLNFHKVIAVGISIGAGLHVVSHLACDFPRLLHATDDEYEPMKPFFGDVKPPNYWWFVKGTEGWTGLVMLVLMAIAFTLAMGWFRNRAPRLCKPKKDENLPQSKKPDILPGPLTRFVSASRKRLTMLIDALLNRFTGYNAFLYTHHLFVIVYALLIVHGHFLYLTKKWQKKTTWMYLAVPMIVYACERLTRTLRSRVRSVQKIKVAVHPDPAALLSLHLSKPEGFRYKSGQYIFVKCPDVSRFQWHPFSITSAPEDDYVSVHIKALGDWTTDLRDAFFKVCKPLTKAKTEILRLEYEHGNAMPTLRDGLKYPTVLIDGPYGAPAQDYKQYDTLLLVGLGIGATPMISIIKDIINNMKRLPAGDIESGNPGDASTSSSSFQTRRAYFYWVTREQESLEWFHGIMDEVAETDKERVIELHVHCTSVHPVGDARSAPITIVQSLNYDKHGIDIISGTRVKTSFGRANWSEVYKHIARQNEGKRVGVFYCGSPILTKDLREFAKVYSRETSTTFEFHKENF